MTDAIDFARLHRDYMQRAAAGLVVGQMVRIDQSSGAFEYGGDAPFGGTIESFRAGDDEAAVRFFALGEDGEWGWATWAFPIGDLEPVSACASDERDGPPEDDA